MSIVDMSSKRISPDFRKAVESMPEHEQRMVAACIQRIRATADEFGVLGGTALILAGIHLLEDFEKQYGIKFS